MFRIRFFGRSVGQSLVQFPGRNVVFLVTKAKSHTCARFEENRTINKTFSNRFFTGLLSGEKCDIFDNLNKEPHVYRISSESNYKNDFLNRSALVHFPERSVVLLLISAKRHLCTELQVMRTINKDFPIGQSRFTFRRKVLSSDNFQVNLPIHKVFVKGQSLVRSSLPVSVRNKAPTYQNSRKQYYKENFEQVRHSPFSREKGIPPVNLDLNTNLYRI